MPQESQNKIKQVIFSAVDRKYFRRYAVAWAWSIFKNEMHAHIHVINPKQRDIRQLKRLAKVTDGLVHFTTGDMEYNLPKDKCYFASFRFLFVEKLSKLYNKVIITDIDSIIREKINFPNKDFGFFHRKPLQTNDLWYHEGSKIAAGLFFVNNENEGNALHFKKTYEKNLMRLYGEGNWRWMIDQRALFETYADLKSMSSNLQFYSFSQMELSWDFDEVALMWTGKGKRKFKNKKYLIEFKKNKKEYRYRVFKNWFCCFFKI